MEITNDVYNAVDRYFSVLSHLGYKSYSEVNKLLVYCFIEEILTGPMSYYVTEKDYAIITGALECLYGTCMMPFPNYKESMSEPVVNVFDPYRITEEGVLRDTENSELRVKS